MQIQQSLRSSKAKSPPIRFAVTSRELVKWSVVYRLLFLSFIKHESLRSTTKTHTLQNWCHFYSKCLGIANDPHWMERSDSPSLSWMKTTCIQRIFVAFFLIGVFSTWKFGKQRQFWVINHKNMCHYASKITSNYHKHSFYWDIF